MTNTKRILRKLKLLRFLIHKMDDIFEQIEIPKHKDRKKDEQ